MDVIAPVNIKVLVIDEQALCFDRFNTIRKLGEHQVTQSGNVHFPKHEISLCTAIKIHESDFCVEFDQDKKIWLVSWKWLCGHFCIIFAFV